MRFSIPLMICLGPLLLSACDPKLPGGQCVAVETDDGSVALDCDGQEFPLPGEADGEDAQIPPELSGCVPGDQQSCACLGGGEGVQTCADSGARWDLCQCPEEPSDDGQSGPPTDEAGDDGQIEMDDGSPTPGDPFMDESSPDTDGPPPAQPEDLVLEGSFVIHNQVDVDFLQPYVEITGSLTVIAEGLTDIELPNLQRLGVDLRLDAMVSLERLSLPELARVGHGISVTDNDALQDLSMPALAELGFALDVSENHALSEFQLDALETIVDNLRIAENPLLESFRFAMLDSVGGNLDIQDNHIMPKLGASFLPALIEIGGNLRIHRNPEIETVVFATLRRVVGDVGVGGGYFLEDNPKLESLLFTELVRIETSLYVENNSALLEARFPALGTVGKDMTIGGCLTGAYASGGIYSQEDYRFDNSGELTCAHGTGNDLLEWLDLSALTDIGEYCRVSDNLVMPQCYAEAVEGQIGKSCNCYGNHGTSSCM